MSKVAVVYWSGTGNTEAMAQAVADGVKEKGGEGELRTSAEFNAAQVDAFDAIAFGCPAMGVEELEESEFARASSPERRSPSSAPTAGATANGCVRGRKPAKRTAPFWPATASPAVKPPTRRPPQPARRSAQRWYNAAPAGNTFPAPDCQKRP